MPFCGQNRVTDPAIVITGANSGIGLAMTRALAGTGARIVMACRDLEKSSVALESIRAGCPGARVELMRLDLASRASIESFADQLLAKKQPVSVLVNNAGVLCHSYRETADGFETTIGVNYIGQYLLTRLLLPLVSRPGGRIVNTSSVMFRLGRVGPGFFVRKKKPFHGFQNYSDSKLAFLLFSLELAERTKTEGITVNSFDPGIVNTKMITLDRWFDPLADLIFRPLIRTAEQGARTGVFLASDQGVAGVTGGYFINNRSRKIPGRVAGHGYRRELWDETERLLGLK